MISKKQPRLPKGRRGFGLYFAGGFGQFHHGEGGIDMAVEPEIL